jgi:hypothetical protein
MRFLIALGLLLQTLACVLSAQAADTAPTAAVQLVNRAQLDDSVQEMARYVARVALNEQGAAKGDYQLHQNQWMPYETAWHTGQMIWGLLHAHRALKDPEFLDAATRAGDWWIAQQISDGPLKGMLNAAHGDRLGPLINFSTLSDGTPGLFELSRVSKNQRYAGVASQAAQWSLANLYLEQPALVLNIVDPATGEIWRDRSPHHAQRPASLTQVARPNIEGFLFLEAGQHLQDQALLAAFSRLTEASLARQHGNGLWMDFEPNSPDGRVHPRFNLWYAEALLRAAQNTADAAAKARLQEAALKTPQAMQSALAADGSMLYDLRDARYGGKSQPEGIAQLQAKGSSLTPSASAFLGIVMLDWRAQNGDSRFDASLHSIARFLIGNRYPSTHPDPNIAGAQRELRQRKEASDLRVRPIANAFALRFLVRYREVFLPNVAVATPEAFDLPLAHLSSRAAQANSQRLDGNWRYIIDPYQVGLNKPRPPRRSLHLDERADAEENPLIEYEWDSARTIAVPSDWNTAVPELRWYEGMLWYQTRFTAKSLKPGDRQFLYFEGANYRTRVWLNGQALKLADGREYHDGGFTPFQFDVSALLRAGSNTLVVAVDSTRRVEAIPSLDFDWFNYGGLTRSVHLLSVSATHIANAQLHLDEPANRAQGAAVWR